MADNVLGVLFQDIANAIRTKTGGTGTMKPAEFPAEIASIVTGGGSGSGEFKYYEKSFLASGVTQTIPHNLGCVPDITIVVLSSVPVVGKLSFGIGFSSAMLAALGGGWLSRVQSATTSGAASVTSNIGVEAADHGYYTTYGGIRSMTDKSFVVGSTNTTGGNLYVDQAYTVICIGGITG